MLDVNKVESMNSFTTCRLPKCALPGTALSYSELTNHRTKNFKDHKQESRITHLKLIQ